LQDETPIGKTFTLTTSCCETGQAKSSALHGADTPKTPPAPFQHFPAKIFPKLARYFPIATKPGFAKLSPDAFIMHFRE
jgi:hypothetical protein